jgi:hypothetical protein
MAVPAYNVLAALREIREGRRERERMKLTTALSFMQLKQAREMQETQLAGERLNMLNTVNKQMQLNHAEDFISTTGLGAVYAQYSADKETGVEEAVGYLEDNYDMTTTDANRTVSALWSYYDAKNPSGILSLANDLTTVMQKPIDADLSGSEKKLVQSLWRKTGLHTDKDSSLNLLGGIQKALKNEKDILAEMFEYGKGDTEIQRDIGVYTPAQINAPTGKLGTGSDDDYDMDLDPMDTVMEQYQGIDKSIKQIEKDIQKKQSHINHLDAQNIVLTNKEKAKNISDDDAIFLSKIPEVKHEFEKDIQELNDKIEEANSIKDNLDDMISKDYGLFYKWFPELYPKEKGVPTKDEAIKKSLDYFKYGSAINPLAGISAAAVGRLIGDVTK